MAKMIGFERALEVSDPIFLSFDAKDALGLAGLKRER
jgi:hypothetical protein